MKKIRIKAGNYDFFAEINNTATAVSIYENLPLEGNASIWGEEIYFTIPLLLEPEPDAREILEPGELAFWCVGSAFCIFFGPTPMSTDNRPRAYSPVNVFGKIIGPVELLKKVKPNEKLLITKE